MASMRDPALLACGDLGEMLRVVAENYGTYVAVHEKKQGFYQHISYGRLQEECEALRVSLCRILPPSSRVLLVGKNSYAFVLSFFALLGGAGVPVLVDRNISEEELCLLAANCRADAVLCDADRKARVSHLTDKKVIGFAELSALIADGKSAIAAGSLSKRKFWVSTP